MVNIIGLIGIVVGTVVSSCCSLAMIIIRLNRKIKPKEIEFRYAGIIREILKNEVALLAAVFVMLLAKNIFANMNLLLQILILGAICVIAYLLTLFFTRSKSLKFLNR